MCDGRRYVCDDRRYVCDSLAVRVTAVVGGGWGAVYYLGAN